MYLHTNTSEPINQVPFRPTWLYIKQHNLTGLKYFGKTIAKDPTKYKGSGMLWKRHLKVHGDNVSTIWCQLFTNKEQLISYALQFSEENNIVESKDWANLVPESGEDGGGAKGKRRGLSDEHKARISESKKGKPASAETIQLLAKYRKSRVYSSLSEETKKKISKAKLGKKSTDATKKLLSSKRKGSGNPNFGKHWYNNGITTISSFTCPAGFSKGKLKK